MPFGSPTNTVFRTYPFDQKVCIIIHAYSFIKNQPIKNSRTIDITLRANRIILTPTKHIKVKIKGDINIAPTSFFIKLFSTK